MRDFLDAKFDQFVEDFNLQKDSKAENWKRFVNYHYFSQLQPGRLDTDLDLLDQTCIDSSEFSEIHGVFFLMNDQILSEPQDIDDIIRRDQKGILELYFLSFGNVDGFAQQLERLFDNLDEIEKNEKWISILSYAMSQNIMLRWEDNPKLKLVIYCEDGRVTELSFSDGFKRCFSDVGKAVNIDRKHLHDIVRSNENSYPGILEDEKSFLIPSGKERLGNAYIICISAKDLVQLITTSEGLLRLNMFDDNVRDSQGYSTVNQEIFATLKEHPERFVLFNNGITIVCKKIEPQNGKYVLENPQIVNGCQTCNMIYQASRRDIDLSGVRVIAKIVGSNVEDVTQGIVRGANRQNIVYEEAFETIKSFHKELEKYFENNQVDGYPKIYYERRSKQYANNTQIKPQQKISFRALIQSMVALFLNRVEDSHKHEYTLLKNYKDDLFVETHSYQPYYLAAFLYLNIDTLFREKRLLKELGSFKMHIILLIKELKGGLSPDLASNQVDKYCERLFEVFKDNKFEQCALEACKKFEDIRKKWIDLKGSQYRYGIKDSAEFRSFLMKEVHGMPDDRNVEKIYIGYVMKVDLDRKGDFYGFIEHAPNNVFFHEFDNPDIDRSYMDKKVSYKIVSNGNRERAINVRLIEDR